MRTPRPRSLIPVIALVSAVTLGSVVGATGAQAAGTVTTFTLGAGALSISAPASVALGAGTPGASITAQLGSVTVTDARALLVAAWTATASSTAFTTGTATAAETVALTHVAYASGLSTATSGLGTFTPGQASTLSPTTLTAPATAFTLALGVGNNSATWNPTMVISVPAAAVTGTYTGTVTHSVA